MEAPTSVSCSSCLGGKDKRAQFGVKEVQGDGKYWAARLKQKFQDLERLFPVASANKFIGLLSPLLYKQTKNTQSIYFPTGLLALERGSGGARELTVLTPSQISRVIYTENCLSGGQVAVLKSQPVGATTPHQGAPGPWGQTSGMRSCC